MAPGGRKLLLSETAIFVFIRCTLLTVHPPYKEERFHAMGFLRILLDQANISSAVIFRVYLLKYITAYPSDIKALQSYSRHTTDGCFSRP
jgi:hypothetical protein